MGWVGCGGVSSCKTTDTNKPLSTTAANPGLQLFRNHQPAEVRLNRSSVSVSISIEKRSSGKRRKQTKRLPSAGGPPRWWLPTKRGALHLPHHPLPPKQPPSRPSRSPSPSEHRRLQSFRGAGGRRTGQTAACVCLRSGDRGPHLATSWARSLQPRASRCPPPNSFRFIVFFPPLLAVRKSRRGPLMRTCSRYS